MKNRLEILKKTLCLEWGELAERIGVSRSLMDKVRTGNREFGPKSERRLKELEASVGLTEPLPSLGKGPAKEFQPLEGTAQILRETPGHYGAERKGALRATIKTLRTQLDELERLLEEKP